MTRTDAGFSLIETIIAMGILASGLLSLAGLMAVGMTHLATSSPNLIAREKAREAIESVHTARDTGLLAWNKIQNVAGGGVFLAGAQPLKVAGADGLVNTADDGAVESQRSAGPNNILGDSDDILTPLSNFTREIQITSLLRDDGSGLVNPNLRAVTVNVRYRLHNTWRTYTLTTYVSSFS
jgi:hypothetical protein